MWKQGNAGVECHGTGEQGLVLSGDATMLRSRILSEFAGQVQCLYMDPPFYTGEIFQHRMRVGEFGWRTGKQQVLLSAYSDRFQSREEYLAFMRDMLSLAHGLLKETGVIFLHIDHRMHAHLRLMLDELFGESNFLNEIVWVYQTGGRAMRHFSRKHDIILFYKKGEDYFFDMSKVPISRTENRSNHMRRQVDEAGRSFRTIRAGNKVYTYYDDEPAYPSDVWSDVSHLQQKDPQRTGYDTQKPLRLLERMILSTTKPGDLVADLCCGSGTTLVAAALNGRRFLGIDSGQSALSVTRKRLLSQHFVMDWPCSPSADCLKANLRTGLGFYEISLEEYTLEPEAESALKKLPERFSLGPLCAVDQWSAGYLKDGIFAANGHGARTKAAPQLPKLLEIPMLTGQLAIEIIDILGRKSIWVYEDH